MIRVLFTALGICVLCAGCASTPSDSKPVEDADVVSQQSTTASLEIQKQPLGYVFRDLAKQTNAGLVLMNGLENVSIDALTVTDMTPQEILNEIGQMTGLTTYMSPHYTFMFDPGYEALTTMDIAKQIPREYDDVRVFASFGSDTPLFSVFALLSKLTGKTIVADNAVADAACGELNFHDIPLAQALEAVLQSARIQQSSFQIKATDDYIFIHSSGHLLRREVVATGISAKDQKLLNQRCSISLLVYSEADNKVRSQLGASKLYKVISELSLQLGMPIRVEEELNHFPVNPVVMNDVKRETALQLFIHQWLVPEFECAIVDGTVVIRRVASS